MVLIVNTVFDLDLVDDPSIINSQIDLIHSNGCTNLSSGLHLSGLQMKNCNSTDIKYLIVFTDGNANEGITELEKIIVFTKELLNKVEGGFKLVILGFGNDCNKDYLERLSNEVDGSYHFLNSAEDIPSAFWRRIWKCSSNQTTEYKN